MSTLTCSTFNPPISTLRSVSPVTTNRENVKSRHHDFTSDNLPALDSYTYFRTMLYEKLSLHSTIERTRKKNNKIETKHPTESHLEP